MSVLRLSWSAPKGTGFSEGPVIFVTLRAVLAGLGRVVTLGAIGPPDEGEIALEVARIGLLGPVRQLIPVAFPGKGLEVGILRGILSGGMTTAAVSQQQVGGMLVAGQ